MNRPRAFRPPAGLLSNRGARIVFTLLAILLIAERLLNDRDIAPQQQPKPESRERSAATAPETLQVRVRRVVDGDTLLLETGERVRLLGVDTPETKKEGTPVEPFGPEASAFTTRMVEGKMVQLVFDRERYDQYQRILAFVYIDDVLLNEELIRAGLSTAQLQYNFRSDMKQRFRAAETEARDKRAGLWSLPTPPRTRH